MAKYATIQVKPETKARLLETGSAGDSQDVALSRLLDEHEGNADLLGDIASLQRQNTTLKSELVKLQKFYEDNKDQVAAMTKAVGLLGGD